MVLTIGLGLLGLAYRVVEGALLAVSRPRLPAIGASNWGADKGAETKDV